MVGHVPHELAASARVAARVGRVAIAAPAAERAQLVLDTLRPLVPFVAAELSAWDPAARRYTTVVSTGYADTVVAHMNGPAFLAECDELGLRRTGAPWRMRDVPRRARAASGTIAEVLRPAGYREGLTMHLRGADGRPAGMLNLSVDDPRHPTDEACALLAELNAVLAAVVRAGAAARRGADLHRLTGRELEVLALVTRGLSNREIAAELVVSARTVSTHVERILHKLGVRSRSAAAARAVDEGLLADGYVT